MRIAYLSGDRGIPVIGTKGASIHIQALTSALARLGHSVTIFTPRRGAMSASLPVEPHRPADFACGLSFNPARDGHVRSDVLPRPDWGGAPPARPNSPQPGGVVAGGIEPHIDVQEILVDTVSLRRPARASALDVETLLKESYGLQVGDAIVEALVAHHARTPFDLIYERYSLWSAAGIRAARRLHVPCFIEVNAPLLDEQQRYRRIALTSEAATIAQELFRQADRILAVSAPVKEYVLAHGGEAGRVLVLPNGVDLRRFHPGVEPMPLPEMDGRFVVGFSGSLKPWHGLELLLAAFQHLHERTPAYHLLIVGDGPLRGWVDGFTQGARLQSAVTLTSWVSHDQVPRFLQRMDIAIAPYAALDTFYFSPLKLFEYLAMGKPIVASRIGQIQDILHDGVTGRLVEPGDPLALAEAIDALRRDREARQALGVAAAQEGAGHGWERVAERIAELALACARSP